MGGPTCMTLIPFPTEPQSSKNAQIAHRQYLKRMEHLLSWNKGNKELDLTSPLDQQVGGTHYKTMKIQPVEFILANDLDFCQGNIIKYTCRYKQKGGVEDLKKVIHYAQLLIDSLERKDDVPTSSSSPNN